MKVNPLLLCFPTEHTLSYSHKNPKKWQLTWEIILVRGKTWIPTMSDTVQEGVVSTAMSSNVTFNLEYRESWWNQTLLWPKTRILQIFPEILGVRFCRGSKVFHNQLETKSRINLKMFIFMLYNHLNFL